MYVFGKNVALELLEKGVKLKKCYLFKNFSDKNIETSLQNKNVPIKYLAKEELDRLSNGNHQGIIMEIEEFVFTALEDVIEGDKKFIVVLDHLEDPHNLGSIIRTCECAGVDGIVIPRNRSVTVNATVMKVSAGALSYVKICEVVNLNSTLNQLKEKGYWVIGAEASGDDYRTINYDGPVALVIGSEGFGLKDLTRKNCDLLASIPMNGKINSLNASVAAGILIFEVLKSRK